MEQAHDVGCLYIFIYINHCLSIAQDDAPASHSETRFIVGCEKDKDNRQSQFGSPSDKVALS
jgi:hypothetical protein